MCVQINSRYCTKRTKRLFQSQKVGRAKRISLSQEKRSGVFSLLVLSHASVSLPGIYQKVSLRLTASVFPQKSPLPFHQSEIENIL
jgi:hypothetical protein